MPKITLPADESYAVDCPQADCGFIGLSTVGWDKAFLETMAHHLESHPELWRTPTQPARLPATEAWEFAVAQMDHWNRRDSSELPIGGNARISGVPLFEATLRLARFVAGEG